ncbi:AzlD domain-containing protein [Anaerococcus hydrogenalis]|uniref:AzlD domain-containing protein n=1 Tax=Anaerococcus hydrogenalis TaxID=33029 RepID=UPI0035CF8B3A
MNNKELPHIVEYLGDNLPPAIMGLLLIFSLKDTNIKIYPYSIPELISSLIIISSYYYRKNSLLPIALGTFFYILLIQYVFV